MAEKLFTSDLEEDKYYYLPHEPDIKVKILYLDWEGAECLVTFRKMTTKRVNRRYYPNWIMWTEVEDMETSSIKENDNDNNMD